jgi:hypothetical protein
VSYEQRSTRKLAGREERRRDPSHPFRQGLVVTEVLAPREQLANPLALSESNFACHYRNAGELYEGDFVVIGAWGETASGNPRRPPTAMILMLFSA